MASPVQIILNASNFSEDREGPTGGGLRTDFFLNDDASFETHRATLLNQFSSISGTLQQQSATFGPIGFVKVILRRKAWAKSHRPIRALFTDRRTPLVGGLDIGQLLFETTAGDLQAVAKQVAQAEGTIDWKVNADGKEEPNPTTRRSETGAIDRVELYGPADKRQFELDQALIWLANARTGGEYEVELFENPPPQPTWDALGNRYSLFHSFVAGLQSMGQGVRAQLVESRAANESPYLTVKLERSTLPPRIQLTAEPATRARSIVPI
jgi:hypothetical protein